MSMSERQRSDRPRPRAMLFQGVVPVVAQPHTAGGQRVWTPASSPSLVDEDKENGAGMWPPTSSDKDFVEPWQLPAVSYHAQSPFADRQELAPWPPVADPSSQAFLGLADEPDAGPALRDEKGEVAAWSPKQMHALEVDRSVPLKKDHVDASSLLPSIPTEGKTPAGETNPVLDSTTAPEQGSKEKAAVAGGQLTAFPFVEEDRNDEGRARTRRVGYLEGLRGIVAIQSLLWTFLRLFCPAVVVAAAPGPTWMVVLRKVLSPVFFDSTLPMSLYIVLMGRVGSQTFIERRKAVALAGPCVRRPVRLLVPIALSLALSTVLNYLGAFSSSAWVADRVHDDYARPPAPITSALVYFNSLVALLFAPQTYDSSRVIDFMQPKGLVWFVSVAFQQTYVLTVVAWTIPYLLRRWKVVGLSALIVLSAWVARWSWYTLTGLALCEFSVVYASTLSPQMTRRLQWASAAALATGFLLKYLWTAAFPSHIDAELVFHADLDTGKLLFDASSSGLVYPRYDDFLVCLGLLALVELTPVLRRALDVAPLRFLGSLGFAIMLTAGPLLLSLGAYIYRELVTHHGWSDDGARAMLFASMMPACLVAAAVWTRIVDDGALWFSRAVYHFLVT